MLDKGTCQSAVEAAFRSMEPGQDGVASLAAQLTDAWINLIKSGTVDTDSTGGGCAYTPVHPPVHSMGKVS